MMMKLGDKYKWMERVGQKVVYRAGTSEMEEGVITSVNSSYVFVRYGSNYGSKATNPEDLELIWGIATNR